MGRRRLAVQVTASTLDQYEHGSWIVDLAPLADPQQVGRAFATALGVHEMPLQDVVAALEVWLRDRQLLLIVDNCEHLIGECAAIVSRLLATCSHLTLLATSREPLGITGETVYRVPSLGLPDASGVQCASVELFAVRAAAVRPSFALGPDNADAIASICSRLDGLPLAIELAAARCRALSPRQIAEQLANRLSLLSGGTRNVLPRQRTLEASVAWSFDLLGDEERSLLRRLSVFGGSFALEGAEAVGAYDQDDSWRVVDMLTGLVDKSLVQVDEHDDTLRYRMLETVRHFAAEQLVLAGESESARDAHARHYLEFVGAIASDLTGPTATERYAELDCERANVRNALVWLVHSERGADAIALAARLSRLWSRSPSSDILQMLEYVLALEGGSALDRAQVIVSCAMVSWLIGDLESNTRHLEALEEHVRGNDIQEIFEYSNVFRGWRGMLLGEPNTVDLLVTAGRALRDLGDYYWSCDAFFGAGNALTERGDCVGAEALFIDSDTDAHRSKDPVAISRSIVFHAMNKMQLGELAAAQKMLDEAAARQSYVADLSVELFGRAFRGWIYAARGHYDSAIEVAAQVAEESRRGGMPISLGWAQWVEVMARRLSHRTDGLDALVQDCGNLMELVGIPWGTAWCGAVRAELALAAGDVVRARAARGGCDRIRCFT